MKKPGRNDPCHCGSGRKYKKCCIDLDRGPALQVERDEHHLLNGRPEISTVQPSTGLRFSATGSTVSWAPASQTKHDFYVDGLRRVFGQEWHEEQQARPEKERHPVEFWDAHYLDMKAGKVPGAPIEQHSPNRFSAPMSGEVLAFLCLGHDLYTVQHAAELPGDLVDRLKNRDQFQGAHYEVAIAAVFARAGYEIEWIRDPSRPRPEFKGRHRSSGSEVLVEAKSRHREGVLGRSGEMPSGDELQIDVRRLMSRALKKETDGLPYVICLDLNLPTDPSPELPALVDEIYNKVLKPFGYETTGQLDPFSALLVTNYSWHWDGHDPAGNPATVAARGEKAAVPLPLKEFHVIEEAVGQYGHIPA